MNPGPLTHLCFSRTLGLTLSGDGRERAYPGSCPMGSRMPGQEHHLLRRRARVLSVLADLPPAWPSDPQRQLSTPRRGVKRGSGSDSSTAWPQCQSITQPLNFSFSLETVGMKTSCLRAGGHPFQAIERNFNPIEKPPDGSVFLGLVTPTSISMRTTLVYVH